MKLKTRLLLATTITVLVILGASEWLNYFSMAAFVQAQRAYALAISLYDRLAAEWVSDLHNASWRLKTAPTSHLVFWPIIRRTLVYRVPFRECLDIFKADNLVPQERLQH